MNYSNYCSFFMKISFEKKLFKIKSLLLVIFSMGIWAYFGGLYGRQNNAELMGMIFAAIVGVLFVLQYIQLFPLILKRLFSLQAYVSEDIPKGIKIYIVKNKAPFSICFSTFYENYILISTEAQENTEIFHTLLEYEKTRLQRGMGLFHTLYIWCIGFLPLLLDYIFFIAVRKSILRYLFAFIGNIVRIITFIYFFLLNLLFYPPSIVYANDQIVSLQLKESQKFIHLLEYLYAEHTKMNFMYFALIPMLVSGPNTFGGMQRFWYRYYPDVKERVRFLKNLIA